MDLINKSVPIIGGLVLAVAALLLYGVMTALTFGLLWAGAIILIEWTLRQAEADRRFIRMMLWGCLALLVACLLFSSLASAVTVTGSQTAESIVWTVSNGTPPYDIWVNGVLVVEDFPGEHIVSPVGGAYEHTAVVTDSTNETASAAVTPVLVMYPVWVWGLIGVWLLLAFLAVRVYIASYGTAALGGFLMLMLLPDVTLAGYLRIASTFFFIVGLSLIFVFRGDD